jgi:predicted nucleic acid-binding protein
MPKTRRRRVYFDPSVFVEVFLGAEEPRFEAAQAAVLDAEQGHTEGMITGLVMAEVVGAPRIRSPEGPPDPDLEERVQAVLDYFKASTFGYVEESRRAGERAMELALRYHLKGPDALHLAYAELAGCETFFTFDGKQLRSSRGQVCGP